MSYFPYGSYQVYYESHGTGRPLTLLHGNTASGRMFDPIIPVLAEKYRVITMDFLGCGRSDRIATWPPICGTNGQIRSALYVSILGSAKSISSGPAAALWRRSMPRWNIRSLYGRWLPTASRASVPIRSS